MHESGTKGLCGFWPYAIWLAQRWHLRALLFDQCGYGGSTCAKDVRTEHDDWITSTQAAVTWARGHGARRVTLIGASFGGIVVLHAAASIRPAVNAVVNLSGELTWSGLDSLPAAHADRADPVRGGSRRPVRDRGRHATDLRSHALPQ